MRGQLGQRKRSCAQAARKRIRTDGSAAVERTKKYRECLVKACESVQDGPSSSHAKEMGELEVAELAELNLRRTCADVVARSCARCFGCASVCPLQSR